MKFCDLTLAYNERSGGIRTYIDQKRRYLLTKTEHDHLLIVPGERDQTERTGRSTIRRIAGPLLPFQDDYRFFARPDKIVQALLEERPDAIELGSYYLSPWAAFRYRQRLQDQGKDCVIGAYFHTDVAEAYVGDPIRNALAEVLGAWSETLRALGMRIADAAELGAESYLNAVYGQCDLVLAASPAQADRLHEYGVADVDLVPLGVDLDCFHPSRRSDTVRRRHGANGDRLVLMYGGRLSQEKRVQVLTDAVTKIPAALKPLLWICGSGPLREPLQELSEREDRVRLLPYQREPCSYARLLASADVYVSAGPHETFGLSVLEAQACGLPIVGVDAGALRERVTPGLGLLGPVDDADAMAANIARVAAQREAIAARARRHVEARFGWKSTFDTWLRLYTEHLRQRFHVLPVHSREARNTSSSDRT